MHIALISILLLSYALSSQVDSLSSIRYLKLPIDFYHKSGSFDMTYGVKDKWELGFDFYFQSDEDEYVRTEEGSDIIQNYTFIENQWVESSDSVKYTDKTISKTSYPFKANTKIALDFKKFFFNKESDSQSRNFYFFLSNSPIKRKGSYNNKETLRVRSKTHEYIEAPSDPQEGDVYGEFYTSDTDTIDHSIDKINIIKDTNFQLGLGLTFDRKLRIFNIPDFLFCADIQLLQFAYSYAKSRKSGTDIDKYDTDFIIEYDEISEDTKIDVSGPSLSLHLKYFF